MCKVDEWIKGRRVVGKHVCLGQNSREGPFMSFLFMHSSYHKCSSFKQHTFSHSFCGSGIWHSLDAFTAQVSKGCNQGVGHTVVLIWGLESSSEFTVVITVISYCGCKTRSQLPDTAFLQRQLTMQLFASFFDTSRIISLSFTFFPKINF